MILPICKEGMAIKIFVANWFYSDSKIRDKRFKKNHKSRVTGTRQWFEGTVIDSVLLGLLSDWLMINLTLVVGTVISDDVRGTKKCGYSIGNKLLALSY